MKRLKGEKVKRRKGKEVKRFFRYVRNTISNVLSLLTSLPLNLFALACVCLFAFLFGCSERLSKPVPVEQVKEAEEKAHMVATLLASGRTVVELYQGLINDPDKGYKHFTPEVFVRKMTDHFGKKTNVKLQLQACPTEDQDKTMDILVLFLDSSKKAIADAQGQINVEGKGHKGFIGAVYGRETSQDFFKKSGIKIKQTTLRYRNPDNVPDKFESKALKMFLNPSYPEGKGYGEVVSKEGKPYYRYMLPIYVEKACLKCHGESEGKADPTGHMKEGYKVGEARWAISVSLPL